MMKRLISKNKEITVVFSGLILLAAVLFLAYKCRNESIRADTAEQKLNNIQEITDKRYSRDSLALVKRFSYNSNLKDSTLLFTKGQESKLQPTNKYYDAKINYIQSAPFSVVDKQYDSIRAIINRKYNRN